MSGPSHAPERGAGGGMQFELKAGPTPGGVLVGVGGLVSVGWLFFYGTHNLRAYPPSGGMDGTLLFAGLPILFGILLLLVLTFGFLGNMGTTITVRKEGLRYASREVFFDANWGRFTYIGPTHNVKGFRSILIGNRETKVRVDELFLPRFDRLVGFLEQLMERIERGSNDDD